MESTLVKKVRLFRGKAAIVRLLRKQEKSKQSILVFCAANHIALSTFNKWKKKYGEIASGEPASPGFAEVTNHIVHRAFYLKSSK